MVWTTHLVAAAALAQVLASSPPAALVAAGASHYLLDAWPHWDYRLSGLDQHKSRLTDLAKVAIDAGIGLAIVVGVFAGLTAFTDVSIFWPLVVAGMGLAIFPDILQAIYRLTGWRWLGPIQAWHDWCHHSSLALKARPVRGILEQAGLIVIILAGLWFLVGG